MKTLIPTLTFALALAFVLPAESRPTKQDRCDRGKLAAAAQHVACRMRAERSFYLKDRPEALARKLTNCDSALEANFAKRETAIPQECSHYDDVQNVKEFNTAVAPCLKNGSASTEGVNCLAAINDESVCLAAGGSWGNDVCTAAASGSCTNLLDGSSSVISRADCEVLLGEVHCGPSPCRCWFEQGVGGNGDLI